MTLEESVQHVVMTAIQEVSMVLDCHLVWKYFSLEVEAFFWLPFIVKLQTRDFPTSDFTIVLIKMNSAQMPE